MATERKQVCLISSAHLSYNPRLLKEADALHEAGYRVRVVVMNLQSSTAEWDRQLMLTRPWPMRSVNARRDSLSGRLTWLKGALRQRLYQRSAWLRRRGLGLEHAFNRFFPEMCRLAASEPAALFVAHNLAALPAAAFAAQRWGTKLGFDAEDFHRGEIAKDDSGRASTREVIEAVETKYIPRCEYLTAASDGIGDAYVTALGVRKPVTILNVFPLSERAGRIPALELQRERKAAGLSLYWYSQVIGSDRGLGDALRALTKLPAGVNLHLRGGWANGYESVFRREVRTLGIEGRVHFLPPVPPEQLVERAAQHDVGLALESGETENRRVAVANKLFTYFLAGLVVAATDVPGQRAVMESAPEAGFLFQPGDAGMLARQLRAWLDDPCELRRAKDRSRQYGESRFCWDREKARLIKAVARVVAR